MVLCTVGGRCSLPGLRGCLHAYLGPTYLRQGPPSQGCCGLAPNAAFVLAFMTTAAGFWSIGKGGISKIAAGRALDAAEAEVAEAEGHLVCQCR